MNLILNNNISLISLVIENDSFSTFERILNDEKTKKVVYYATTVGKMIHVLLYNKEIIEKGLDKPFKKCMFKLNIQNQYSIDEILKINWVIGSMPVYGKGNLIVNDKILKFLVGQVKNIINNENKTLLLKCPTTKIVGEYGEFKAYNKDRLGIILDFLVSIMSKKKRVKGEFVSTFVKTNDFFSTAAEDSDYNIDNRYYYKTEYDYIVKVGRKFNIIILLDDKDISDKNTEEFAKGLVDPIYYTTKSGIIDYARPHTSWLYNHMYNGLVIDVYDVKNHTYIGEELTRGRLKNRYKNNTKKFFAELDLETENEEFDDFFNDIPLSPFEILNKLSNVINDKVNNLFKEINNSLGGKCKTRGQLLDYIDFIRDISKEYVIYNVVIDKVLNKYIKEIKEVYSSFNGVFDDEYFGNSIYFEDAVYDDKHIEDEEEEKESEEDFEDEDF